MILICLQILFLMTPSASPNPGLNEQLAAAVIGARTEDVLRLLKDEADADFRVGHQTLLILALVHAGPELATLLLEHGAKPGAQTAAGNVLHQCAVLGRVRALERFLALKVDVNAVDSLGRSPLMIAAQNSDTRMIRLLVAAGAAVSLQDHNGDTALHFAVLRGHAPTADLLLRHRADHKLKNSAGKSPMSLLGLTRHQVMLNLFRKHGKVLVPGQPAGIQPETTDNSIWALVRDGRLEELKLLPKEQLSSKRDGDWCLLLEAVRAGRWETARYLLASGADPNQAYAAARTPLGAALERGDAGLVQLLQQHGADLLGQVQGQKIKAPTTTVVAVLLELFEKHALTLAAEAPRYGEKVGNPAVAFGAEGLIPPAITRKTAMTAPKDRPDVQGSLVLEAVLGQHNNIYDIRVVKPAGDWALGLELQAIRAVLQWAWEPGVQNDKPVPVRMKLLLACPEKTP